MAIRLYLDEDSMEPGLVRALLARGINVVTAAQVDQLGCDDEEHLDYSTKQGRVLVSFNRADFYRIHTKWLSAGRIHGGIILVKQQEYSVGEQLRRLLNLIARISSEEMKNRVEFLSNWR